MAEGIRDERLVQAKAALKKAIQFAEESSSEDEDME